MTKKYFPGAEGILERTHAALREAELYNNILRVSGEIVAQGTPFNHHTPECAALENCLSEMNYRVSENIDGYPLFALLLEKVDEARLELGCGNVWDHKPIFAQCVAASGLEPVDSGVLADKKKSSLAKIKDLPDEDLRHNFLELSQKVYRYSRMNIRVEYERVEPAEDLALLKDYLREISDRTKKEPDSHPLLVEIVEAALLTTAVPAIARGVVLSGLHSVVPKRTDTPKPGARHSVPSV
ncbi:MAG: hypothetical protein PHY92_04435 [Alphaproteobacteria bacterium]|nr:hypothetical protein [Alphaproteobacteria bacterium]